MSRLCRKSVERSIRDMWSALAETDIDDDGRDAAVEQAHATEARLMGSLAAQDRLDVAAPDLLAACKLLEDAEDRNANCEECGGEGEPEACGTCVPFFDRAREARIEAIAKAEGRSAAALRHWLETGTLPKPADDADDPPPCRYCPHLHDPDEPCVEPYTLGEMQAMQAAMEPWDR